MNPEAAIYPITFLLAAFAMGSSFCRIANIDMKGVQYRYVAPFVLIFVSALGIGTSLVGGDKTSWYQPVVLLAFSLYLWNTRVDWKNGMPQHYKSGVRDRRAAPRSPQRIAAENAVVGTFVVAALGIAGVGSASGRGNPVQVYSSHAEPPALMSGDTLHILYTFRRVRACPGYVNRFIVSLETGEIAQRFDAKPVGGTKVGQKMTDYPTSVQLIDLAPGRYAYRALMYSNCDDAAYTQTLPDVPFIVSPPMK